MTSKSGKWKGAGPMVQVLRVEAGEKKACSRHLERGRFLSVLLEGMRTATQVGGDGVSACNGPGPHGHAAKPLNDL